METGANKAYAATMASGGTTANVNLWRAYERVYVQVPASVGAAINVNVSLDGITYSPHYFMIPSSTVQFARAVIPSTVTNCFVEIPGGYSYYQIEATAAVANGAVFKIIGNH